MKADSGETVKCHPTAEAAEAHRKALYANAGPEAQAGSAYGAKGEIIITFGAAVKALGGGVVGGYLVQFGSEATKDADGEWFTDETDFDQEFPSRASIYYNHGLDPVVGRKRLAHGTMKADDLGVWVEAQLDLADRYQAAMYQMAKAGKLGWSSGSLSHITDPPRERPGGAIKSWPLGHDASLTPIPSDRRNLAIALKSWEPPPLEELAIDDLPPSLAEDLDRVADYTERVRARCAGIKAGTYQFSQSRRERIARLRDELSALLEETDPGQRTAATTDETPPGPGEGAGPVKQEEERAVPPVLPLPGLDDLYSAMLRQETGALTLTGRY